MPPRSQTDALRGALDLLILKTLSFAPMHGWGINQRVQQISRGALEVNQGRAASQATRSHSRSIP
jgi:PadR family transcriptional regulator PadR